MTRRSSFLVLAVLAFGAGCGGAACPARSPDTAKPAEEIPATPEAALTRLLKAPEADAAWFSEDFIRAVPAVQVTQLLNRFRAELGAFQQARPANSHYEVVFEKGTVPSRVYLDDKGRFAGLWFGHPNLTSVSLEETVTALKRLPGRVSVLVTGPSGEDVVALEPEAALSVGSAFKLAIIEELRERIAASKATWQTVVLLEPQHKSLPSGSLQEWPDKTPFTLATLAGLMISQSDNTATDALLSYLGRETVERISPRNKPFLSTRESFVFEAKGNAALFDRYQKADEAGERAVLAEISRKPLPDIGAVRDDAIKGLGWFFTARELCALLRDVAELPAFSINPGLAKKKDFDAVAFKGGSQPGVLNLTTLVKKNGQSMCLAATWNDTKPVDEERLLTAYQALLAVARERLGQSTPQTARP